MAGGGVSDHWPASLPPRDVAAERAGFRQHAAALARWTFDHLTVRTDVWGGYWPLHLRENRAKVRTCPPVKLRGARSLTADVLQRHFEGNDVGDIVGLHSTSRNNECRAGAFDGDSHGDDVDLVALSTGATLLCEWLAESGVAPLLVDSDGVGGWHIRFYFDRLVPAADLHRWLHEFALRCERACGIRPECYPKQGTLPPGGFGNWLRLPGLHHTRDHVSAVCRPGEPWSLGGDAAETILHRWPATPADVVPPLSAWPQPEHVPATGTPVVSLEDVPRDRARVIAAYCRKLPHGAAGTCRSDRLFSLARFLRHAMQCTSVEALPILHGWNGGNTPPLPTEKVTATWENAARYADRPVTLRAHGRRYAA